MHDVSSPTPRGYRHTPVMMNEVLAHLDPKPGKVVVDCTLGGSGHSAAILRRIQPDGLLIATDRDPAALENAKKILPAISGHFHLFQGSFTELPEHLASLGVTAVDGILADLGISLHQIEGSGRGFSFQRDEQLDMRMNPDQATTAAGILNRAEEADLARIFKAYGEERFAGRIARAVRKEREKAPILTTRQLAEMVQRVVPNRPQRKRGGTHRRPIHPATRVFMALRIAVNEELENLQRFMETAPSLLSPGGRLCVISFHSLEDRIVKHAIRDMAEGCQCPKALPQCVCGRKPVLVNLTRKGVRPTLEEVSSNPLARSATLRAAEKRPEPRESL